MNSQQELLDAINTISQKQDKSCDTPATVLRVEDDTVWVHIDGGADETPVRKTISCEQGETVQVRISNGSAFLVGNASAPPTDDKTANVAHFVAEQADIKAVKAEEKATEAVESVHALEQTVVRTGDSNISLLSSTLYQNEYGVDIFNDTLEAGDSYAHIDGDSFDIRRAKTAGTIDDEHDETVAKFGQTSILSQLIPSGDPYVGPTGSVFTFSPEKLNIEFFSDALMRDMISELAASYLMINDDPTARGYIMKIGGNMIVHSLNDEPGSWPDSDAFMHYRNGFLYLKNDLRVDGKIKDANGNIIAPTVLESTTISTSTTSYTFTNSAIKADSVIDIYDTIFGFSPTAMTVSAGSCTVTFPAQSSSHQIKLFVY